MSKDRKFSHSSWVCCLVNLRSSVPQPDGTLQGAKAASSIHQLHRGQGAASHAVLGAFLVRGVGEVQHWSLEGVLDAAAGKLEEQSRIQAMWGLGHCTSVSCTVCFLNSKGICEKTSFR